MALSAHRKVVTVLFCDVVGSTALGESVDPEALQGLLARYFERMKGIVEAHGGSVEKFIGDAVMAVFGVPVAHEDDALRACRAAFEMRASLPELGIVGRIGVNTGEALTGTEERLATGDALNVAARLEQAAQPGEVLIGSETLALVEAAVEVGEERLLELKGKSAPVAAHPLLSVRDVAGRSHGSPFVGREPELGLLIGAWETALAGRSCELVTLVGDPGVGKSRLVAEALAQIDVRVVSGRCLSYGEGITYWPVVEVVKQLGTLPSDESAANAIRSLLGESDAASGTDEIAWAFRKLLEEQSPLVVSFDDIQWGEETFLDLVESMALLSTGAPLLLLCMARPELLDRRPGWPATLRLEPLLEEQAKTLVGEAVPDAVRQRIVRAAGGNPLFLTEMVALSSGDGGEVEVPPTLRALLAARLDQLAEPERRVLERGAVEGELFHRGTIQALAPEETEVTPRLAALVRRDLVRPDQPRLPREDAYRFRHLLIRDAAYEALPKTTRADLHRRLADWLEEQGQSLVELDELLGYHLEQAHRYRVELGGNGSLDELARRASVRLTAAARRSLTVGDGYAAANLFGRAISLVEPAGRKGVEVLLDLASACVFLGEPGQARIHCEQAVALAEVVGDRALELRAACDLAELRTSVDPSFTAEQALELGYLAVRELEPLGADRALAAAWALVASGENTRARWLRVESALERVIQHAGRAGDRNRETVALGRLAHSIFWGPTPLSVGLPRVEAILERARGKKALEGRALRPVAGFYAMQGRFDEARALLAQSRSIAEELARPPAGLAFWGGPLEMLAGDPEAAERELRAACDSFESMGEMAFLSTIASELAEALYMQDRFVDAEAAVRLSHEVATSDDYNAQAQWRCAEAKLLARRGVFDEAEALARQAIDFISRSDELNSKGLVWLGLVEVYRLAGRRDDAIAALDEAIALFERKENAVMAERSRALRAELSSG